MRKLKKYLYALVSSAVLFSSCGDEEIAQSTKVKFEILNLSTQNVELFIYGRNNQLEISESIRFMDSTIVEEGFIHPAPDGPDYKLTTSRLDSAVIVFADDRKLTQTAFSRGNNDAVNNILIESHYIINNEQDISRFQFTISLADYERAK